MHSVIFYVSNVKINIITGSWKSSNVNNNRQYFSSMSKKTNSQLLIKAIQWMKYFYLIIQFCNVCHAGSFFIVCMHAW